MTRCVWCGACPVELHHVTGRMSSRGAYFDPSVTLGVCARHHSAEHVLLRRLGLDWPAPDVVPLAYRLCRFGTVLRRSHDLGRPFVLTPSSSHGAHLLVIEAAEALGRVP